MSEVGGFSDQSAGKVFDSQQSQEVDGGDASAVSQPITSSAELTKSDGTKMKLSVTHNPEQVEGKGIRGSGFGDKVPDFMGLPTLQNDSGFKAEKGDKETDESSLVQDRLKELKKDEHEEVKEGSAKEMLHREGHEILNKEVYGKH